MTARRGPLVAIVVALATLAGAVPAVGPAAAAQPHVAIQNVSVAPETPQVGQAVRVTTTVANFESSPGFARITEVSLMAGGDILASVDDVGTVGAGGFVEVPLSTTFERPGQHSLQVRVSGRGEDGGVFNLQSAVTVSVRATKEVQLNVEPEHAPATESAVGVTVANGKTTAISNLQLDLHGPRASVEDPRRVKASLAAGSEHAATYRVTFDEPGDRTLTAELTYRNENADRRTVTETVRLDVEAAVVDAELDAAVVRTGAGAGVNATVTNFGNVPLRDVRLRAVADGETVARSLLPNVPIEASRSVALGESELPAGEVRLVADYEAVGRRYETATVVDFAPSIHGNISLTGVEVTRAGGSVTLAGSASNTGETAVTGAVVAVVDTAEVTPAPPAGDYFVGNVPAGEFTSFELTARTAGNRTQSVPVRIRYIAEGEEYSRVVEVSIANAGPPSFGPGGPPGGPGDGPGGPGGPFAALFRIDVVGILLRLAAVVAVVGGAVYWWRRRSGRDGEL